LRKKGRTRKGGFIRRLTKESKQYTLVYVETNTGRMNSLGVFSSFDEAKLFLKDYIDNYYGIEPQLLSTGKCVIFTDENRVVYSTERGEVDAE